MTNSVMQIRNVDDLKEKLAVIAKKWLLEHIIREDMQIEKFRRSVCQITSSMPKKSSNEAEYEEKKIKYTCQCKGKIHLVPSTLHNEIQKEKALFNCKVCKAIIQFLEM